MQSVSTSLDYTKHSDKKIILIITISDLLLYIISFVTIMYVKKGEISYGVLQPGVITTFLIIWLFSTLATKKFIRLFNRSLLENIRSFFLSFFLLLGGFSVCINLFPVAGISRFVLAGFLLLSLFIETSFLWFFSTTLKIDLSPLRLIKSRKFFFTDISIISLCLAAYLLLNPGFFNGDENHIIILVGYYFIWFTSSVFVHQFRLNFNKNYWKYLSSFLNSYLVFFCLLNFFLFLFKTQDELKEDILLYTFFYTCCSFFTFSKLYFVQLSKRADSSRIEYLSSNDASDNLVDIDKISGKGLYNPEYAEEYVKSFREKLKEIYLKKFPALFDFIDTKINLNKINISTSIVFRTNDLYNVEVLPENCLEAFINLQRLNDVRRINRYLIEVYNKLQPNGIFISSFQPIKNRYKKFISKYPFYFAVIFYMLDFIWSRVIPKTPIVQKFYFNITKGRNRAISLAEGIGRLYYSGFHLISAFEHEDEFYFIAKKNSLPHNEKVNSYGLFFKMKRQGKNGKDIFVYKLRTMHPYSEYIQKFVYEINKLEIGGKLKDDFRVTSWGRVLRKLWIDELPMIINLLKGELKLVGVRPLSNHYLSLYDKELRDIRKKFKPGLIPPFYADMPKTLQEIIDSEKRYLDAYEKNPIRTDIKYLLMAFNNILLKSARSK